MREITREVELPDGRTEEFDVPEDWTDEQIAKAAINYFNISKSDQQKQPQEKKPQGWQGVFSDVLKSIGGIPKFGKEIATETIPALAEGSGQLLNPQRLATNLAIATNKGMLGMWNTIPEMADYLNKKGLGLSQKGINPEMAKGFGETPDETLFGNIAKLKVPLGLTGLEQEALSMSPKSYIGRDEIGDQAIQGLGKIGSYAMFPEKRLLDSLFKGALFNIGQGADPIHGALGFGAPKIIGKTVEVAPKVGKAALHPVKTAEDLLASYIAKKAKNVPIEEIEANQRAAEGTNTQLGNIVVNPSLVDFYQNVSSRTPFSRGYEGLQEAGKQVEQRSGQVLESVAPQGVEDYVSANDALKFSIQSKGDPFKTEGTEIVESLKPKEIKDGGDLDEITHSLLKEAKSIQKDIKNEIYSERNKLAEQENLSLRVPSFRKEVKRISKSIKDSALYKYDPRFRSQMNKFMTFGEGLKEKRVGTDVFQKEKTPVDTEIPIRDERTIDAESYITDHPELEGTRKLSGVPESFMFQPNGIVSFKPKQSFQSSALEKQGTRLPEEGFTPTDVFTKEAEKPPISEPLEAEKAGDRYEKGKRVYSFKGATPTLSEAQIFASDLYEKSQKIKRSVNPIDQMVANNLEKVSKALKTDINRSVKKGSPELQKLHESANKNYRENYVPFLDKEINKKLIQENPEKIVNDIIKPSKSLDQYKNIKKIQDLLPKEKQSILSYRYFRNAFDKNGELIPSELARLVNNLGTRQFENLVRDPQLRQSLINYAKQYEAMKNDPIYKIATDPSESADALARKIISPNKTTDSSSKVRRVVSMLPEDQKNLVGYAYLRGSVDKDGIVDPKKLAQLIDNMGKKQFEETFPDPEVRKSLLDYSKLRQMNSHALDVMFMPKTGHSLGMMMFIAALKTNPIKTVATFLGSRKFNQLMTEETFRNTVIDKIKNPKIKLSTQEQYYLKSAIGQAVLRAGTVPNRSDKQK
jgi:hypothetical protein